MYFLTPSRLLPSGVGGVAILSAAHFAWFSCSLLFCAAVVAWFCRASGYARRRVLHAAATVMVLCEALRMPALAFSGGFSAADSLPLHLCGVMVFVEWYAAFYGRPLALELSWCLGLPGAFCALATPGETAYPFWNIYYLQFILVHTLLFLIPLLLRAEGFRPAIRRLPQCFLFLLGLAAFDAFANCLFGGNYLFLSAPPPGSLLEAVYRLAGPSFYLPAAAGAVWGIWAVYYGVPRLFHRKSAALSRR